MGGSEKGGMGVRNRLWDGSTGGRVMRRKVQRIIADFVSMSAVYEPDDKPNLSNQMDYKCNPTFFQFIGLQNIGQCPMHPYL